MPRLIALALLLLAACGTPPSDPGLRDAGTQMYSTASFDPQGLLGHWVQVGEVTKAPGCQPGFMDLAAKDDAIQIDWKLCLDGQRREGRGRIEPLGYGRFQVPGSKDPWWVLWADADGRTLVLGTPSGRFGVVLDRGAIPADREKAAANVLVWNGYHADLLRMQ